MNGKIGFTSQSGKGSSFWFDMPVAGVGQPAESPIGPVKDEVRMPRLGNDESRPVILCIEDNLINVQFIEAFFEDIENVILIIATTAEQGIHLAQSKRPDLILMDIGLPDISGIEATRRLKSLSATSHIPVIALSAAAMADDIERAQQVNFEGYVTKPIQVDEFLDLLESVLGERLS